MIKLININKKFSDHEVIKDFSYVFESKNITALVGTSGCGKSTLLNIIGLLEYPTSGSVEMFGKKNIKPYSKEAKKLLRNKIGYLLQDFALVESKSVEYNINLAIEEHKLKNKKDLINNALKEVGLVGFNGKIISECSGGEKQRVAIARLMIKPCEVVLADEPTGSLDKETANIIFDLLCKLKDKGKTVIMVTHDIELANKCDVILQLKKN